MRFAIELDGRLIGGAGYYRRRSGTAELGFWLGREWWGRGYATEATTAVLQHGFEAGRLPGFTSSHFVDNHASAGVLRKLGFEPTGRGRIICTARGHEVEAVTYWLPAKRAARHADRVPPAQTAGALARLAGQARRPAGLSATGLQDGGERYGMRPRPLISGATMTLANDDTIRTERLLLRPLRSSDAEPLLRAVCQLGGHPLAQHAARGPTRPRRCARLHRAQMAVSPWPRNYFAITLDDALIGGVEPAAGPAA